MSKTTALRLSGGALGKRVTFRAGQFGTVSGKLVEFGVPYEHPSIMTHPISCIEIKIRDNGQVATFEVPPATEVVVSDV